MRTRSLGLLLGLVMSLMGPSGCDNLVTITANTSIVPVGSSLVLSNLSPVEGPAGTTVTLSGTGFDANPINDVVVFTVAGGGHGQGRGQLCKQHPPDGRGTCRRHHR